MPAAAVQLAPEWVEYHTAAVSAVAHTMEEPSGAIAMGPPPVLVPAGIVAKGVQVRPASVEITPYGVVPFVVRTTVVGVFCSKSSPAGVARGFGYMPCAGD